MADIGIGSSLTGLSGQLTSHSGIICISLLDEPVIIPGDSGSVNPADLLIQDILQFGERYGSMLVRIRNARFTASGSTFQAGQDYQVNQGSDTVTIGINFFNAGLEGMTIPGLASVTGILIQAYDTIYVAPRYTADLEIQTGDFEYDPSKVLVIAPNPGPGVYTITGHQLTGPARINVFDLAGQKIYESVFEDIESVDIIVNLEGRPAGTYILFMTVKDNIFISLLVKTE
jgi:hypothetical protein